MFSTGRLNIAKMSVLCELNYGFNEIPIKIPAKLFVDMKTDPKVYMERQKAQNSQINNNKKEQSWKTDITQLQEAL